MPAALARGLALLMALQGLLGLALRAAYRDPAWIRATWLGNDLVTLVLAAPALLLAVRLARKGSTRGLLLWLGLLGYGAYDYAYYMLGAVLNPFFPLYVGGFVLSAAALVLTLAALDPEAVAAAFPRSAPLRLVAGYDIFVALGLTCVWLGTWAAHVFGGRPTPVEEPAFRLVASLDLSLMVTALACGGLLLWRRRPWGYVVGAIAGTQASLYLLVLSLNSALAIGQGLVQAPGELPIWGTLALATTAATLLLLRGVTGLGGSGRIGKE